MARHKRSYSGERLTASMKVNLTPSELREQRAAAAAQGATLSAYARELLVFRSAAGGLVGSSRRNPEAAALKREIEAAGHAENAIGNLLNQIARHLNMSGEMRDREELYEALALYKKAAERHIEALERVIAS